MLIWTYQFPSWYRAQSVQNLFHASQYFFMVWVYKFRKAAALDVNYGDAYRDLAGALATAGAPAPIVGTPYSASRASMSARRRPSP